MSSQLLKSKRPNTRANLSSQTAMAEFRHRVIASLAKLSDRDTSEVAVRDLTSTIGTLSAETLPIFLNSLYDSISDQTFRGKKEAINLLSTTCKSCPDLVSPHVPKMASNIVKRLGDSDSNVRDACVDVIGVLSGVYLYDRDGAGKVGVFARVLFEAMGEHNKWMQNGAALCLARMVECGHTRSDGGDGNMMNLTVVEFQKMCPKICKLLNGKNFQAKSSLLLAIASFAQVGAIAPQSIEALLHVTQNSLRSIDWAIRKAAADALCAIASHSSHLIQDSSASSTITALESCRFDKIKPVRDSVVEALQSWKMISGEVSEDILNDPNSALSDTDKSEKGGHANNGKKSTSIVSSGPSDLPNGASDAIDSSTKSKAGIFPEKTPARAKTRAPSFSSREPNPNFFQKLTTKNTSEIPIEVAVPRRLIGADTPKDGEKSDPIVCNDREIMSPERGVEREVVDQDLRNGASRNGGICFPPTISSLDSRIAEDEEKEDDDFVDGKRNGVSVHKRLLKMERQQSILVNMLQEFMDGTENGMNNLERRVRVLERAVDEMSEDLSATLGNRGGRGKFLHQRYDALDVRDTSVYRSLGNTQVFNGPVSRCSSSDGVSPASEPETNHAGSRRMWGPRATPIRLVEGPSSRSMWKASKDESTIEAIHEAGEDRVPVRRGRRSMGDENPVRLLGTPSARWARAINAVKMGDAERAFLEVSLAENDILLSKLMEKTGPVLDRLSCDTAHAVLSAMARFLSEQSLISTCLAWIQQLVEITEEDGPGALRVPAELKQLLLTALQMVCSVDPTSKWEGVAPANCLLLRLSTLWHMQQYRLPQ